MNSGKIMDGRFDFEVKLHDQQGDLISAYKYLFQKYFLYLLKITLRSKV